MTRIINMQRLPLFWRTWQITS